MDELCYKTKVFGTVTIRPGFNDGRVTIEIWYENKVIARFEIEYVWDFLAKVFRNNPPRHDPKDHKHIRNYQDWGSRYYCMNVADCFRPVLSANVPNLSALLEVIQRLAETMTSEIPNQMKKEDK